MFGRVLYTLLDTAECIEVIFSLLKFLEKLVLGSCKLHYDHHVAYSKRVSFQVNIDVKMNCKLSFAGAAVYRCFTE